MLTAGGDTPARDPGPKAGRPAGDEIVDDHAHPFAQSYQPFDWGGPGLGAVPTKAGKVTPVWIRVLEGKLSSLLGCQRAEVTSAREQRASDWSSYVRLLADDVGLCATLMDGGSRVLRTEDLSTMQGLYHRPVFNIARIEAVADPLLAQGADADTIASAVQQMLVEQAGAGAVAAKTVLAYRTGLAVDPGATREAAQRSLETYRLATGSGLRSAATEDSSGRAREPGSLEPIPPGVSPGVIDRATMPLQKPFRDWLTRLVLRWCGELSLPLQIHSGLGDADLAIADADPAGLDPVLRTAEGNAATVVLIHGAFPWHEKAAFMTGVHHNLYLEISLHPIFSPLTTPDRLLRVLDLIAPSKLLSGSDGHHQPELQWIGLRNLIDAWETVGAQLGPALGADWVEQARTAALSSNARRVYGLDHRS